MKEAFIDYKINNMTLQEKIGQMIMIDYRNTLEMNTSLENILTKYNPGGFILFRSNISNFNQTKKLLQEIKQSADIPLSLAVDEEGGRVQRLDKRVGIEKIPPMSEIGMTNNTSVAFEIGKKIGKKLKEIGIDMDMAPILDIFSNPQNTVIGNRSFGSNSDIVTKMAFALSDGLKSENIIPVGKHFPGHGDTIKDSHVDLPIVAKTLEELKELELIPFAKAVNQKLPGLMVGHIAVHKVTNSNDPASLSDIMINDILRKDMGYKGIVMPDSLKMKALSNYFTDEDIYLKCINAGNDILLMPQDISKAFNIIYEHVNMGIIKEERINESVRRILSTKFDYGFFNKEYEEFIKNKNKHKQKILVIFD